MQFAPSSGVSRHINELINAVPLISCSCSRIGMKEEKGKNNGMKNESVRIGSERERNEIASSFKGKLLSGRERS